MLLQTIIKLYIFILINVRVSASTLRRLRLRQRLRRLRRRRHPPRYHRHSLGDMEYKRGHTRQRVCPRENPRVCQDPAPAGHQKLPGRTCRTRNTEEISRTTRR